MRVPAEADGDVVRVARRIVLRDGQHGAPRLPGARSDVVQEQIAVAERPAEAGAVETAWRATKEALDAPGLRAFGELLRHDAVSTRSRERRRLGWASIGRVELRDHRLFTPVPPMLLGGTYEVVSPAARGGMASVWLGVARGAAGFKRKVAIKRVLRKLRQDQKFEQMFVEEAQLVADLSHPNIVQVHDFGRDMDGGYFIVMEWVEGLNLAGWVQAHADAGGKPPWHLTSAICIEVLRALAAAHEHVDDEGRPVPIIHRDVAPSNILLGINGNVKLTDFGLARAMNQSGRVGADETAGKLGYLAPEILHGASPDPRVDVYGVGVVLWESLAARRLFGGGDRTDVDIAKRILRAEVPPLAELRPELPRELCDCVSRALASDPAKRFQSAREMIGALSTILRHHPEPSDGAALARNARAVLAGLEATARRLGAP